MRRWIVLMALVTLVVSAWPGQQAAIATLASGSVAAAGRADREAAASPAPAAAGIATGASSSAAADAVAAAGAAATSSPPAPTSGPDPAPSPPAAPAPAPDPAPAPEPTPAPANSASGRQAAALTVDSGGRQSRRIALTIDAGAGRGYPDKYLQILSSKNVKATFFITGNWARDNGADLKALATAGHEIANHTVSHPDLTTLPRAEGRQQILDTEALLTAAVPQAFRKYFRPPYGSYNAGTLNLLQELGYINVMWHVDTLDWMNKGSAFVADRVRRLSRGGSIILMHMAAPDTVAVLAELIDWLRAQGYELVSLGVLLGRVEPAPPAAASSGGGPAAPGAAPGVPAAAARP